MVVESQGVLTCWSSGLAVWADSDPFLWTITQSWGLDVNSTIDEPRGASTCRSSTLAFLVDCDPFRGLLLTVLGSHSDFHSY